MATWNRKAPPASQPNSSGNHDNAAITRINNAIAEENAGIFKQIINNKKTKTN